MPDQLNPRKYYSARNGGGRAPELSLSEIRDLLLSTYEHFEERGYFVEAFGYHCADGFESGYAGADVDNYMKLALLRGGVWPLSKSVNSLSEEDVFDVIECLYDHVSKPRVRNYHSFCGDHVSDFSPEEGQAEYRARINILLGRYVDGWELSESGQVLSLAPEGMKNLLVAPLPTPEKTILEKVAEATALFRRHGSTITDRRNAVRELADVLELLRPQIKTALLKPDENELFNIANNFGIRHMNQNQKTGYDRAVWLSWMFYHFLNTINAFLHILKRQAKESEPATPL